MVQHLSIPFPTAPRGLVQFQIFLMLQHVGLEIDISPQR
jgi:hypothetical protein